MVVVAIKLHQFSFKVFADSGKDAPSIVAYLFGKHLSPIFCDEAQVAGSCGGAPISAIRHYIEQQLTPS